MPSSVRARFRPDGVDKVTGRALYGADFQAAGLLHGKVLRSPHAHARIRSTDTSKAEALPGVRAVITGGDLPPSNGDTGLRRSLDNLLAGDKALYVGHAVAAVAAINPHVAEEAAGLIEVEYDVLPSVLTAPEAMKDERASPSQRPEDPIVGSTYQQGQQRRRL